MSEFKLKPSDFSAKRIKIGNSLAQGEISLKDALKICKKEAKTSEKINDKRGASIWNETGNFFKHRLEDTNLGLNTDRVIEKNGKPKFTRNDLQVMTDEKGNIDYNYYY